MPRIATSRFGRLLESRVATATRRGQWLGTAVLALTMAGCATEPATGTLEGASTVDDHVAAGCSTAVVLGLSQQIADEVGCMLSGELVSFPEGNGIVFSGSAVLPYLAPDARADLLAAAAANGGTLEVTSAYRTVVQQYLLYRWYQDGRCGITAAATPGNSNHESGRAVDVGNYGVWISAMSARGWAHDVPGDDVHFDHLASADLRGSDVLAFQRLWNRNHPTDVIDEDGDYGPATGARIASAPAEGFAIGASCAASRAVTSHLVSGPSTLASGAHATFTIELTNTGSIAWPATTRLVTSAPMDRASALTDPAHWTSASEVAPIGVAVAPGAKVAIEIAVIGPPVDAATRFDEQFALVDGDARFGMIDVSVDVVPADQGPGDGSGGDDGVVGGCAGGGSSSGGSAGASLVIAVVLARRRRRA